jgi:hypothetical protein
MISGQGGDEGRADGGQSIRALERTRDKGRLLKSYRSGVDRVAVEAPASVNEPSINSDEPTTGDVHCQRGQKPTGGFHCDPQHVWRRSFAEGLATTPHLK